MGTVTVAGQTVEIFGDEAGFRAYAATSIHGDGALAASGSERQRALVTANRVIQRQRYVGQRTDPAQSSGVFPRTGIADRDGVPIDPAVIPVDVISAEYEIALDLLGAESTIQTQTAQAEFKRERTDRTVGPIRTVTDVERFGGLNDAGTNASRFPQIVSELLGFLLVGGSSLGTGKSGVGVVEAFGADAHSTIEGVPYGLSGNGLP